jgi:hypothetical protein
MLWRASPEVGLALSVWGSSVAPRVGRSASAVAGGATGWRRCDRTVQGPVTTGPYQGRIVRRIRRPVDSWAATGPYRGGLACDIFHNLYRDFFARTIRTCPRAGGVCAPAAPIPLIDHGH